MKIAITSTGSDLTSQIDARFGRCPHFIIIDLDTEKFEVVENPNIQVMGGAGIQSAQLIASKGVEVVLTGSCGPNAFQTLSVAGVKVIAGISGIVQEAIEGFKSGKFQSTNTPNVGAHFGTGFGIGRGGMGGGRSAGKGMGRGQGRGMVQGVGGDVTYPKTKASGMMPQGMDRSQERDYLKKEAESLKKQVADIKKRIQELEEGK